MTMAGQRIGLFGGTFDPIHLGHLLLAVHSYEELDLNRVIFIPARLPPHKAQPIVEPADRLQMVRLAVADDDRFLVCDCELCRAEPSYTIDTVQQFQQSLDAGTVDLSSRRIYQRNQSPDGIFPKDFSKTGRSATGRYSDLW